MNKEHIYGLQVLGMGEGQRHSAAVIGLQMASAYVGSTFMPLVFGHLQQYLGIWIMPFYLLLFAALNIGMLETAYRKLM